MTDLVVRRLLIDLETPIARHWCADDAFLSALFNALSMSFPVGEQFFIDSVRRGVQALAPEQQKQFQREAQGFIGQEATHRRIHGLFNSHLEKQGLDNRWGPRALARQAVLEGVDPRHCLAITAAYEHFTAIFAEWMLANHGVFKDSEPRLKTMWLWHSAEESEHRNTAFDLYLALDGDHAWRMKWFRRISMIFLTDLLRQTVNNLRRDGTLWKWQTWKSAARFLLGRDGLIRQSYRPWRQYKQPDFHPAQQSGELSRRWLAEHAGSYTVVSG